MLIKINAGNIQSPLSQAGATDVTIFVRGYIIHRERLYLENECNAFIREDYRKERLFKEIPGYNGCWQLILIDYSQSRIIIANDRWGTYPLFRVESGNELWISDKWKELLPLSGKEILAQAAWEMAAFGYVLGDKTLIRNIWDYPSHTIVSYDLRKGGRSCEEYNYWHLSYRFQPAKESREEKKFAELWQRRMHIYAEALRRLGNACYIPMSGGLDSRLLATAMDEHKVRIHAMTMGSGEHYPEIKVARDVVEALRFSAGHEIQYLDQARLKYLADSPQHPNLITCGYFGQLYLEPFYAVREQCRVIMPGVSGDFMAGSLIRYRMLSWKRNREALDYIISLRSAPMVKALLADPAYHQNIHDALSGTFPKDDDVISNYVRWFTEHDIRRYLIRSNLNENNPHGHLILPFFDYVLIDYFLDLPVELLINKRLYINTQIKYLYKSNPRMLEIPRAKPYEKIRPVGNAFLREYGSKLRNKIKNLSSSSEKKQLWGRDVDWYEVFAEMEFPQWMNPDLIRHPVLLEKPAYLKYFDTVSRVYKELRQ